MYLVLGYHHIRDSWMSILLPSTVFARDYGWYFRGSRFWFFPVNWAYMIVVEWVCCYPIPLQCWIMLSHGCTELGAWHRCVLQSVKLLYLELFMGVNTNIISPRLLFSQYYHSICMLSVYLCFLSLWSISICQHSVMCWPADFNADLMWRWWLSLFALATSDI